MKVIRDLNQRVKTLEMPFKIEMQLQLLTKSDNLYMKNMKTTYLKKLCKHVIVHRSLEYILGKFPKTGSWVHDAIPQFREKKDKNAF